MAGVLFQKLSWLDYRVPLGRANVLIHLPGAPDLKAMVCGFCVGLGASHIILETQTGVYCMIYIYNKIKIK